MLVLTSGKTYLDIDGYASGIAYRELLHLQGIEAKFVSDATLNSSVTKSLRDLPFSLDKYEIQPTDKFVILDLQNPEFLPDFVWEENIVEVIDHHSGFKDYWENKLGEKCDIGMGSVAEIIFKRYENANLVDKISPDIAKLLASVILDHTANFTRNKVKDESKRIYARLMEIIKNANFANEYFTECQRVIEEDLKSAIINDLKFENFGGNFIEALGQLQTWEAKSILQRETEIREIMAQKAKNWVLNIASLKEVKSYIFCSNEQIFNFLKGKLGAQVKDNMLVVSGALSRKNIMDAFREEIK